MNSNNIHTLRTYVTYLTKSTISNCLNTFGWAWQLPNQLDNVAMNRFLQRTDEMIQACDDRGVGLANFSAFNLVRDFIKGEEVDLDGLDMEEFRTNHFIQSSKSITFSTFLFLVLNSTYVVEHEFVGAAVDWIDELTVLQPEISNPPKVEFAMPLLRCQGKFNDEIGNYSVTELLCYYLFGRETQFVRSLKVNGLPFVQLVSANDTIKDILNVICCYRAISLLIILSTEHPTDPGLFMITPFPEDNWSYYEHNQLINIQKFRPLIAKIRDEDGVEKFSTVYIRTTYDDDCWFYRTVNGINLCDFELIDSEGNTVDVFHDPDED